MDLRRAKAILLLAFTLFFLMQLVPLLWEPPVKVTEAQAAGWLQGWLYRKRIVIAGSTAGAVSNYTISITLVWSSGTDNATHIFLNGRARSDFGDVRFTASDGVTLLSYWFEEGTLVANQSVRVWVRVPSIPASPSTTDIYIYYGNSSATSISNGTATFIFYDSFETYPADTSINGQGGWVVMRIGGSGEANVRLVNSTKFLNLSSTNTETAVVRPVNVANSVSMMARVFVQKAGEAFIQGFSDGQITSGGDVYNGYHLVWWGWTNARTRLGRMTDGSEIYLTGQNDNTGSGVYYVLEFQWYGSTLRGVRNSSLFINATDSYYTSRTYIHMSVWAPAIFLVDWVVVRPLVLPEPGVSSVGSEESPLTISSLSASSPVYAYRPGWVNASISTSLPLSNFTVTFPVATVVWVNGTGLSASGPVAVSNASFTWVSSTLVNATLLYSPLPGFTGGSATVRACNTAGLCTNATVAVSYVERYSTSLTIQNRVTAGTAPQYTITTNYTGTTRLYNLQAYINLTPPTSIQPGDVLAPHLYDWYFDGVNDYVGLTFAFNNEFSFTTFFNRLGRGVDAQGWETVFRFESTNLKYYLRTRASDLYVTLNIHNGTTAVIITDPITATRPLWYTTYLSTSAMRLYREGVLVGTLTPVPIPSSATGNLTIGIFGTTEAFNGTVSTLISHGRALSDSEIVTLYNSRVVNSSGLRLLLDATFFNGTHYIDLSGYGNHGVPYNGVARVPANSTWLWVIHGNYSDGLVRFRFFPNGTVIVFSNGDALAVTGSPNQAGLVEEFAVARSDVAYILVPSPTAWSQSTVYARSDVGSLSFIVYMDAPAVYPFVTATVIYDKLMLAEWGVSVPSNTRVDAYRTSVTAWARFIHAYDSTPVTGGSIMLFNNTVASFNGTYWVATLSPPGSVAGPRTYNLVGSAVSQLNVSFVDPTPLLSYIWDALRANVTGVDYIGEVANITLVYHSDGSPVNGTATVSYAGSSWNVSVVNGFAVFSLTSLPANVTSPPLVYGSSDGGYVSTSVANSSIPFARLRGDWWSARSPVLNFTVSTWVFNGSRVFRASTGQMLVAWFPIEPAFIYASAGYTLIRGSAYAVVSSGDLVAGLDKPLAQASIAPAPAPGTGDVWVGLSSSLYSPLNGSLVLYARVNSSGVFIGIRRNGTVLSERVLSTGALPPASLVYTYDYDAAANTTAWCSMIVYLSGFTRYAVACLNAAVAPPPSMYPFIGTDGGIVVDRFAVTVGTAVKYLASGDIVYSFQGTYPATSIVKYVKVDKPTVVELAGGDIRVYPGSAGGITFKGFAGFKLSIAIGGVTVSNYLIPSSSHVLDIPLGFAAYLIVDPVGQSITIVSTSPVKEQVNLTFDVAGPAAPPAPAGAPVGVSAPPPSLSVLTTVVVGTVAAVSMTVYRSTRRVTHALTVAGATVSLIGVVYGISGATQGSFAIVLVATGVLVAAVSIALSVGKE